ncbi:MAG: segregation and condensation protein A [Sideroxydans sp.]|nr:segregation and condensation protein A [Sideroxydans sp.]
MSTEELSKEQRILRQMRKTLGSVVRDATPLGGRPNPLTENTIEEIKACFTLIAERERELATQLGFDEAKPYYKDGSEHQSAQIISLIKPAKH